jgi:hypothetical protein
MGRKHRIAAIAGAVCATAVLGSCLHSQGIEPQGMAWTSYHTPEEGAKLAYGAPNSDNVVLMLTCAPGSREVQLSTHAAGPGKAIVLKSGRADTAIPAVAVETGMGHGAYLEATARSTDPALSAFARTGDLALVEPGRTLKMKASRAEQAQVSAFFQTCQA